MQISCVLADDEVMLTIKPGQVMISGGLVVTMRRVGGLVVSMRRDGGLVVTMRRDGLGGW